MKIEISQTSKRLLATIREKRISKNLSQREAALLAGIRKNQWQVIEAGEVELKVDILIRMAKALKLNVAIEIG